jgi:adenylate cyclase
MDMHGGSVRLVRNGSDGYSLAMGIGLAKGQATIGGIGFEGRRDYGAIGRVTNLAARLCGEAKGGQILLSAEVAQASQAGIAVEAVAALTLKGFAAPVETYQVV